MRACRDAVKAGRCDGARAGCEVTSPRLDGVEHGASLEGPRRRSCRHIPYAVFVRHGRPCDKEWCEGMRVPPAPWPSQLGLFQRTQASEWARSSFKFFLKGPSIRSVY